MNRRGSVMDVLLIGVIIFSFAIGFFILNYMMTVSVDKITNVSAVNDSAGAVSAFNSIKTLMGRLDYVVGGLFFGLVVALMVSGWYIGGNPIFMFLYFLIVVIGVVVSVILSNTWETVSQLPAFGTTVASFPIANHLLLYLPIYIAVIGGLGMLVMFAKPYLGNTEVGGGGHL